MQSAPIARGMLVFGVVGALWGAELASLLRVGCFAHDGGIELFALPVLLPCAMMFAGSVAAWIAARRRRSERALMITVLIPATGMLTGVVAGIVWWPDGIGEATADGLAFGAVALVLLGPVVRSLGGRARRGSLIDQADGYATWARGGVAACVVSVLTLPRWKTYAACTSEPWQAIVATVASALIAVVACGMLLRHAVRCRRLLGSPLGFLDIGVGDARVEIASHSPTAYRHPFYKLGTIHGDVEAARDALRSHERATLMLTALGVATAVAGIVLRCV